MSSNPIVVLSTDAKNEGIDLENYLLYLIYVATSGGGGSGWELDGNLNATLKYIGTNDNFDFPINVNSVEAARFLALNGNFGININAPTAKLHVKSITSMLANAIAIFQNAANTANFIFNDDGNVYINSPQFTGFALQVAGSNVMQFVTTSPIDAKFRMPNTFSFARNSDDFITLYKDGINWSFQKAGNVALTPTAKLTIQGEDFSLANYALNVSNSVNAILLSVRNDGFLGVGTNAPTRKLEVLDGYIKTNWGLEVDGGTFFGVRFNASGFSRFAIDGGFKLNGTFIDGFIFTNGTKIFFNYDQAGLNGDTFQIADSLIKGKTAGSLDLTKYVGINVSGIPTSTFDVNGSISKAQIAVVANTLINETNHVIYIDANGTTQTLPDAALCEGRIYTFKLRTNSVSSCTILSSGGTIDLAASYTITNLGGGQLNGITVQSDGTNWNILY